MTATEFLARLEKLRTRIIIFTLIVPMGVMVIGMAALAIYTPGNMISTVWIVLALTPAVVAALLGFWIPSNARNRLIKKHSEMEHLEEWMSLMGSAENYPFDDARKIAFLPEAFAILERYARSANMAFNVRNLNRELRDRYPKNSFQWASLDTFCDGLAKRADEINTKEYNHRWYLFVDHLKIKVNPDNVRTFREQFLKDDPLSSVKIA